MKNPALVIINVQKGFEETRWGERNNIHKFFTRRHPYNVEYIRITTYM